MIQFELMSFSNDGLGFLFATVKLGYNKMHEFCIICFLNVTMSCKTGKFTIEKIIIMVFLKINIEIS